MLSHIYQAYFWVKMAKRILELILDGRRQSEFADSLHIPRAVMSEFMRLGKYPADKHLRKIMKAENASMSALWGASSAPFMVHRTISETETFESLKMHLDDHNWTIHLITGDEFPIFVLSTLAMDVIDNKEFKYTQVEVISGPVDFALANLFRDKKVKHIELPPDEAHQLATGYKGTYYLFGKETLLGAKIISQADLIKIFRNRSTKHAQVLNNVMELVDETVVEEGIELTAEERRKLVTELYTYAVEQNLIPEEVTPSLAHLMLRLI